MFARLMVRGARPVSVGLNGCKYQNLEGEDNILGNGCRCRLMEAWGLK